MLTNRNLLMMTLSYYADIDSISGARRGAARRTALDGLWAHGPPTSPAEPVSVIGDDIALAAALAGDVAVWLPD